MSEIHSAIMYRAVVGVVLDPPPGPPPPPPPRDVYYINTWNGAFLFLDPIFLKRFDNPQKNCCTRRALDFLRILGQFGRLLTSQK